MNHEAVYRTAPATPGLLIMGEYNLCVNIIMGEYKLLVGGQRNKQTHTHTHTSIP